MLDFSSLKGNSRACCVAFMGAPEAMVERLASGAELPLALAKVEKLCSMGFHERLSEEEIENLAVVNNLKLWREGSGLVSLALMLSKACLHCYVFVIIG